MATKIQWKIASVLDAAVAVKLGWHIGTDTSPDTSKVVSGDLLVRWYDTHDTMMYPVNSHPRPLRVGFHPSESADAATEIMSFLRARRQRHPFQVVFEPLADSLLEKFRWECSIREPERVRFPEIFGHSFGGSTSEALCNAFIKVDLRRFVDDNNK